MQGASQKIKTDEVFWKLGNQTSVYQESFCCNLQNARKCHPEKNISKPDFIQHKSPLRNAFFFVYHKFDWDKEQKQFTEINIDFSKIKVVNKYHRWVRTSIRSVENCSSLEILNAFMTGLQAITQICHAQYYFKYNLKS